MNRSAKLVGAPSMPLSVGNKLGPYEILAPIGSGGMGEVWKARDTRLDRLVAIKRLKIQRGKRFEQEARAIAALNHPNICQIFDIGPDYLVLEFIAGAPLRGPLAAGEALPLALQIASALEAAHKRGILHRDLKPSNVMVTEAGAKLLDFGLAKLTADSDAGATVTTEGATIGTAAYMSPEQARGEAIDERSDIFSFGAMLYEALSGRRAFGGQSILETLNAVVSADPAPLDSPASDIVKRCLAKHPSQRFQSAFELTEALKAAMAELSSPARARQTLQPSIAVLPFANMSGDREQEYFSDGLTDEIINALVRIPGLRVIARTSAFAFKGQNIDIRRIAETLGVGYILEGSVRRSGNRIRVTAQLITADDGSHLWSERFDRELADLFEMQDDLSASIAAILQPRLTRQAARRRHYVPKPGAHEALLRAWYYTWKLTPESLTQAGQFFKQAIALDPGFALARSGYAEYLFIVAHVGAGSAHDTMPMLRDEALKALELDPSLPKAHTVLALFGATYDYDWKEAERRFARAMADGPVSPWIRALYAGYYLLPAGRFDDVIKQGELALEGDPLHLTIRATFAISLHAAGQTAEAERQIRQTLDIDPDFAYLTAAAHYTSRCMFAEALAYAEKAYLRIPWAAHTVAPLAGLLARAGDKKRAEELVEQIRTGPAYLANIGLTYFCMYSGDIEGAADWAEKVIEDRWPSICSALSSGLAADLRASARWPKLAKMLNLPVAASTAV